jgi:hypothetical protein
MTSAWRIQRLDADTYRFFNISGASADGITLGSAAPDEMDEAEQTIEIVGPVDHLLGPSTSPYYFDHAVAPGDYVLHWQAGDASVVARHTSTFRLPPPANTTLLLADFAEREESVSG